jgi:hypothetical protein
LGLINPTSHPLTWAHGLPMRGNSHLIICRYGSPRDGSRSIAFLAKGLACSSVCRLSFGSDIHSRTIFRRAACSGFMSKSFPNGGRRQHKGRAVLRKCSRKENHRRPAANRPPSTRSPKPSSASAARMAACSRLRAEQSRGPTRMCDQALNLGICPKSTLSIPRRWPRLETLRMFAYALLKLPKATSGSFGSALANMHRGFGYVLGARRGLKTQLYACLRSRHGRPRALPVIDANQR